MRSRAPPPRGRVLRHVASRCALQQGLPDVREYPHQRAGENCARSLRSVWRFPGEKRSASQRTTLAKGARACAFHPARFRGLPRYSPRSPGSPSRSRCCSACSSASASSSAEARPPRGARARRGAAHARPPLAGNAARHRRAFHRAGGGLPRGISGLRRGRAGRQSELQALAWDARVTQAERAARREPRPRGGIPRLCVPRRECRPAP